MRLHSALVRAEGRIMNSRPLRIAAIVVSLVVALSGRSAPVHAQPAGNAVTEWNLIAANTLLLFPPPAGGAPPALQVNMAMVQGAVYDALNAIEPNPASSAISPRDAFRLDCLEGGRRGDRGIQRPLEYRFDGAAAFRSRTGRTCCRRWTRRMKPRLRQYRTDHPGPRGSPPGTPRPTR